LGVKIRPIKKGVKPVYFYYDRTYQKINFFGSFWDGIKKLFNKTICVVGLG